MKLTKYEHACFTLEKDGKLLVIDPGEFTTSLGSPENVVVIVVTHEHADHFDANALGAVVAHNPDALILAPESITDKLGDALPTRTVSADDTVEVGPFKLKFSGGQHATIHDSIPTPENFAVMIDDAVFYPGDSFVEPNHTVDVLALPVAAPWMKLSEAIDYVVTVKPKLTFPTHDALLSDSGKAMVDTMIGSFVEKTGGTYQRISDPIDI